MGSDHCCSDTGLTSIVAYAMSDGTAGQRIMRHLYAQEDPPRLSMTRPFIVKIGGQRSCYCRQQRQIDRCPRFRSAHSQNFRPPVYVVKTQPQYLRNTKSVG